MNTFVSLLRGINVSGQKSIRMAELQALYESLHYRNVTTYLQSGNIVFDSDEPDRIAVAGRIQAAIERAFGYAVTVLLRDRDDFQRIVDHNPFLGARQEDPAKLHVTFLAAALPAAAWASLPAPPDTADEFSPHGGEVYLFCPDGYGRTAFSNSYFERRLKLAATTRNWKTVTALHALVGAR
jgi:uncharacterized protein (DUF1697 family)